MKGRLVALNLSKQVERAKVVLASRLQANVLQLGCIWDNSIKHIPKHFPIDLAVLFFTRFAGPRDIEGVSNIGELGKLLSGLIRIRDITLDVVDWVIHVPGGPGAASHAIDLPGSARGVREREDLGEAVANYASDPNDEGYALVLGRFIVIIQFLLLINNLVLYVRN